MFGVKNGPEEAAVGDGTAGSKEEIIDHGEDDIDHRKGDVEETSIREAENQEKLPNED